MSFAYMPLYTGDYLRDTQHLSMLEHGAYFKLLMYCWDQKGPAPLDERKLHGICNARSKEDISAMLQVLNEFFVRCDDGWYNERMQREIERAEATSERRSDAGRKGYAAKVKSLKAKDIQASAKQMPSKSQASAKQVPLSPSPSLSLTPDPSSTPTQGKRKDGAPSVPSDVTEQVWHDFLQTRKQLRAAVTDTAITGIRREADKAGITLEAALRMCCARGWRGFKAEWVVNGKPDKAGQAERVKKLLFGEQS